MREKRIDKLRREAMAEIWTDQGFEGVKALLTGSDAAGTIGQYTGYCITRLKPRVDFIRRCLAVSGHLQPQAEWCLRGFLVAIEDDPRVELLTTAMKGLFTNDFVRLLICAPFQESTWRLLDHHEDLCAQYWKEVYPSWGRHTTAELTELIDCLLEVKRPRAAFHTVHMDFKDIETSRLKRLLRDVATVNAEPTGHFKLDAYYISDALNALDGRKGITRDEMAQLEFLFIDALDHSDHGLPNLEYQIAESPTVFVQAVALTYKRRDNGEDPPEWRIDNPEQKLVVANTAHRLLNQIKTIPGTDKNGKIDVVALGAWLEEVRRLCRKIGRADVGDHCIGKLLARGPVGEDGIRPSEAVRVAMEEVASPEIGRGFYIGILNSRGFHCRSEGGAQERELAARYRAWAERLHFDYPHVGGILEDIAASYDREAGWEDSKAKVAKRLRH